MKMAQFTPVLILNFKINIHNALYWLKGPGNIQFFILAQRLWDLYWLKGPEFYKGSKALKLILSFILAQRPDNIYWLILILMTQFHKKLNFVQNLSFY